MAQVAVALGRHAEGERCLLGSALLPSEGLSGWDTGAGWPALPEKSGAKVTWVHMVGVGMKGREVLGLPAVFIYSSKIYI